MLDTSSLTLDAGRDPHSQLATPSSIPDSSLLFGTMSSGFTENPTQAFAQHQRAPNPLQFGRLGLTLDPSQLRPSSLGPTRITTRRQARIAQQSGGYSPVVDDHDLQSHRQQYDDVRLSDFFHLRGPC